MDPFAEFDEQGAEDLSGPVGVERALEAQAELLIAVATGGPRIDGVNGTYKRRRSALRPALKRLGLSDPFPWSDLWGWYGEWSSKLPDYASRRIRIRDLVDPVVERLREMQAQEHLADWEQDGALQWPGLETRLEGVKAELAAARELDDFQDVGRRCREILIDAATLVFNEDFVPDGHAVPGANDAKARVGYFLQARFPGSSNKELRKVVNGGFDLANKVTHSDSADRPSAFVVAQATIFLCRVLQALASGDTEGQATTAVEGAS